MYSWKSIGIKLFWIIIILLGYRLVFLQPRTWISETKPTKDSIFIPSLKREEHVPEIERLLLEKLDTVSKKTDVLRQEISLINRRISNLSGYNEELTSRMDVQQEYIENQMKNIFEIVSFNQETIQEKDCQLTDEEAKRYPECLSKMNFVKKYQEHKCYEEHGVSGTLCSIRKYLSEVEPYCPLMPHHKKRFFQFEVRRLPDSERSWTNKDMTYDGLIEMLTRHGKVEYYTWIQNRIQYMWKGWSNAVNVLNLPRRRKQKVLVYLGFLALGFHRATKIGGPLGELVQWSDIITVLYLLGHDVTVTVEPSHTVEYLSNTQFLHLPCKNQQGEKFYVDLIYTDVTGFKKIQNQLNEETLRNNQCAFRVVDSFGTEPAYNWMPYAKRHKLETYWGQLNLNPKQFFTLYPHSPDNSFMGFAIQETEWKNYTYKEKLNQALVYGKQEYMWKNKSQYIETIRETGLEIHATVALGDNILPQFVHNHGVLETHQVRQILRDSKIFIGMGFPYEGPAPLEALAEGCVFLNGAFHPPHSSENNDFFAGKPTSRKITSQLPYAESIGAPNVLNVNIDDKRQVLQAVIQAVQSVDAGVVKPFIPREFTEVGMLERVNAYLENDNFCATTRPLWPPESETQIITTKPSQSCIDACHEHDLICEPAHFKRINNREWMVKAFQDECYSIIAGTNHIYPAKHLISKTCYMQNEDMIFSCAGEKEHFQRLCPCRNYIKEQIAMCQKCL